MALSEGLATLPNLLREQASKLPDSDFFRHVDGRRLTFEGMFRASVSFAATLADFGVARGDSVATVVPDKIDSSVVWLGVAWAGAVEVPVNPQLTGTSLAHIVNDSGARFLVTTTALAAGVAQAADLMPGLEHVVLIDEGAQDVLPGIRVRHVDLYADGSDVREAALPELEVWDPACIIYTSGTTGPPKGVLVPWGQVTYGLESPIFFPRDTHGPRYSYTPAYHMSGKNALNIAASFGDPLVVRETFSLSQFWSDIRAHGCTYAQLFPQLMTLLLRAPEQPDDLDNPLEVVMCIPAVPQVDEFKRRFGVRRIATAFGMTEIAAIITQRDVSSANWDSAGIVSGTSAGFEARIVDEHDTPVPQGEVGELIVRSREPWALNAGYLNAPAATATAWRNGWFHTGDAMRQDEEGVYFFVDRMKDCIRRKGENISSFDVEHHVNRYAGVAECAAIGVPAELGEEEVKVVVVARPGETLDPAALHAFLQETMPRFMVPRYIEIVEDLPKTPATGRIRKVELKKKTSGQVWDSAAGEH